MNKSELVAAMAEKTEMSKKDTMTALDALLEVVSEQLGAGNEVALTGFGTFKTRVQAARTGRNPQTGETIQIAEKTVPVFKAGKTLKDAVKSAE